jgi:hypothetical protein
MVSKHRWSLNKGKMYMKCTTLVLEKGWSFYIGGCLIQVFLKAGLTVFVVICTDSCRLWFSTALATIFQLNCGGQFHRRKKMVYLGEKHRYSTSH